MTGPRELVAAGQGDVRDHFVDFNQTRRLLYFGTARNYLTYFEPDSDAEMRVTARRVPPRVPVLTVIGDRDPFFSRVRTVLVRKLPANPASRVIEVKADHSGTPAAGAEQAAEWIRSVLPPPATRN